MIKNNYKKIFLIGIGGIGMSALAKFFIQKKKVVEGYDRIRSKITIELESLSCRIFYDESILNISNNFKVNKDVLVIYTPAISQKNLIFNFFKFNKYPLFKRSEILGKISENSDTIAVAGSHGKTTICSILASILNHNYNDFTCFVGGILKDYKSNFISGSSDKFLIEADEFDRSFLCLSPKYIIISSIDFDHQDCYNNYEDLYKSFIEFSIKVNHKNLIVKEGLRIDSKYTYSLNSNTSNFYSENLRKKNDNFVFDIVYPGGKAKNIYTNLKCFHNIENIVAAFSLAYLNKIKISDIIQSIREFTGVKRRFEYHINNKKIKYIDDYAHHPNEISVIIKSLRELYRNKKISIIFQPHLYSRTFHLLDDFASVLSMSDEVMLLDIYGARENAYNSVSIVDLLKKINCSEKGVYKKTSFPNILNKDNIDILLTLGAGDISDLVSPIKFYLDD